MSSPVDLDPYETLGVPKDADLATIRTAHRKLVLKSHPDKIRDESLREQGIIQFQKVQQSYELLSDATRRQRYDDRMELIKLQKERMYRREQERREAAAREDARDPLRSSTRSSRATAGATSSGSQPYDEPIVENRRPEDFDIRDPYDDLPSRTSRKSATAPKASERKERSSKGTFSSSREIPQDIKNRMKEKASAAREKAARKQKERDQDIRYERSAKHDGRRYGDSHSESDGETVLPKERSKSYKSSSRAKVDSDPESGRSRGSHKKAAYSDNESYDEKWENHHRKSAEYISKSSKRPAMARAGSGYYWETDRPSRSDSEKQSSPKKSSSRRSNTDDYHHPIPSMPTYNSDPVNLRPRVVNRDPEEMPRGPPSRSKTTAFSGERDGRRDAHPGPGLTRANTMPVRPKKEGAAPSRGSNLRTSETLDSGYYSSSNPNTPDMRGDSPPARRPTKPSTKYTIVDMAPESDDELSGRVPRVARRIIESDDERRIYRSPDRYSTREHAGERERDSDRTRKPQRPNPIRVETDGGRSRSHQAPSREHSRYDSQSQSPREAPSQSRGKTFFGEVEDRDSPASYAYRTAPSSYKTTSYSRPSITPHRGRENSYERFQGPNHPTAGRRSSAAAA